MTPGQPRKDPNSTDLGSSPLGEIPTTIATYAFWGGLIVLVLSLFSTIYLMSAAGGDAAKANQIAQTMQLLLKGLMAGSVLTALGSAFLFWEEEMMVAFNIAGACLLFFSSAYLPLILGSTTNAGTDAGYNALQSAGTIYFLIAMAILVGDIANRVRQRALVGAKKDTLRYGKGIKEDNDKQNVFMGKCWQLPYCRKFVRDRCPIFHAQRTCWRELVGCMCEEAVIKVAMEGKPISKEALLSGAAIPRNNKLTDGAKRERCKNCVIYNEHQKHKYKLAMPTVLIGYAALFVLIRVPLTTAINNALDKGTKTVSNLSAGTVKAVDTGEWFTNFLVGAIVVVFLAYTIKIVEYAIFKLKI
ncbi:MAG TPA: hypothetical protein VK171_08715 [Fimbriimonas sp.]|nr:hypothetical protein [Fimbriimonas sp.]